MIREHFAEDGNAEEKRELLDEVSSRVAIGYFHPCPKCGYPMYARQTISPKYKCKMCRTETDNPEKKQSPESRKAMRTEFRRLFLHKHKEEIDKIFAEVKENSNKNYLDFQNVTVLCRRCHYAREKGLVLCKVCHKQYHKPKFEKCWECFKKTSMGKAIAQKNQLFPYVHPWCKRTFQVKGEVWVAEANPRMCCIEQCHEDPNKCDLALRNWSQ
jgi:ribosomal protein L37AE/L43A